MALTGRFVVLVLLGLAAVALVPRGATVAAWLLACLALAGLDLALAASPGRLRLQRDPIERLHRGERTDTRLVATNEGRRPMRGLLRDAWPPSAGAAGERHALRLLPGASAVLTTALAPTRRGDRHPDRVTIRLVGPLGLAARQRSVRVPGRVQVLPAFDSRRHLPALLADLRLLDGRSAVRVRGRGTEFDSLRDYVAGDDVRSIDWRATARRREPVVRTWRPERDRRLVVVLDTGRTSAARVGDEPRLDASLDAALLLVALASRAGDRVDLVAGDASVRARLAGRRGPRSLHDATQTVTPLEPALVEADWDVLASAVDALAPGRALVVLLTALDPTVVEEGLLPTLPALTRRHRVLVGSVLDPELARLAAGDACLDDVYDAAAAERELAQRHDLADVLRRLGVDVVEAGPDELPLALARRYLDLKSAGML